MRTKPRWFAYPAIDELAGFFALAMGGEWAGGTRGRGARSDRRPRGAHALDPTESRSVECPHALIFGRTATWGADGT